VLADELDGMLAPSPASPPTAPALEPVPVDLAALAFHLDQSEASTDTHHLHLLTGQIEPASPPRRGRGAVADVLRIEPQGSHEVYWDMKEFTATVAERSLHQLLDVALGGRGAFRRFREVLSAYPGPPPKATAPPQTARSPRARVPAFCCTVQTNAGLTLHNAAD